MIGVICRAEQQVFVEEFFELFKTPWEPYVAGKSYDAVIVTRPLDGLPETGLLIVCGPQPSMPGWPATTPLGANAGGVLLQHAGQPFPVYGPVATIEVSRSAVVTTASSGAVAGAVFTVDGRRILRLGYDPFDEARTLLVDGQPAMHASMPALDIHINVVRQAIADAGVAVVEIAPLPNGYEFGVCLSHDVDFINLRDHGIDRSVVGFVARALLPQRYRNTRSRVAWSRIFRNWMAVLTLPAVYLRLWRDTWFDIDRFQNIEKDLASTYFFIPFKGRPGRPQPGGRSDSLRAAPYDAKVYAPLVKTLAGTSEIGTHGIDAWHNGPQAAEERALVGSLAGRPVQGVRMHWLYFSPESPQALEAAGFSYDSTLGYNETVGFRSGTTQVFRLPGTTGLYELPLNVMDSALFYPTRMNLTEREALDVCRGVVNTAAAFGGNLTVNWHTRSLRPERNWDEFYLELIRLFKERRAWFATAGELVEWFKARRTVRFDDVTQGPDGVRITVSSAATKPLRAILRVTHTVPDATSGAMTCVTTDRLLSISRSETHHVALEETELQPC